MPSSAGLLRVSQVAEQVRLTRRLLWIRPDRLRQGVIWYFAMRMASHCSANRSQPHRNQTLTLPNDQTLRLPFDQDLDSLISSKPTSKSESLYRSGVARELSWSIHQQRDSHLNQHPLRGPMRCPTVILSKLVQPFFFEKETRIRQHRCRIGELTRQRRLSLTTTEYFRCPCPLHGQNDCQAELVWLCRLRNRRLLLRSRQIASESLMCDRRRVYGPIRSAADCRKRL